MRYPGSVCVIACIIQSSRTSVLHSTCPPAPICRDSGIEVARLGEANWRRTKNQARLHSATGSHAPFRSARWGRALRFGARDGVARSVSERATGESRAVSLKRASRVPEATQPFPDRSQTVRGCVRVGSPSWAPRPMGPVVLRVPQDM